MSRSLAELAVLAQAAKTAPDGTLFVMAGLLAHCRYPREHDEVTLHAFTPEGIRSRTLERGPDGWSWLRKPPRPEGRSFLLHGAPPSSNPPQAGTVVSTAQKPLRSSTVPTPWLWAQATVAGGAYRIQRRMSSAFLLWPS